jgi:hypothetical protein
MTLGAEAGNIDVMDAITGAKFVAIVGSRLYPINEGRERVATLIGLMNADIDATVVTGGAPGVDTWAEECAAQRGLRCSIVRPSKMGLHLAGDYMMRNTVIVRGSDVVVAFWDGVSKGTEDSIEKALLYHGMVIVALPGKSPIVWVPF